MLMKLPGSDQLEYLLMSPFTPQNRDNMIAWLAARCDFPDYGTMVFYELPKEKLVYGPNQVAAMIDQNTTISQQLTLWDQKGSGVIRGKLVVIPIENSFLYVVPLYLRAEGTNFPELKRVIAATGNMVVMEPTLDEAVSALFGSPDVQQTVTQTPIGNTELDRARVQLAEVQKAIDALKRLLNGPVARARRAWLRASDRSSGKGSPCRLQLALGSLTGTCGILTSALSITHCPLPCSGRDVKSRRDRMESPATRRRVDSG